MLTSAHRNPYQMDRVVTYVLSIGALIIHWGLLSLGLSSSPISCLAAGGACVLLHRLIRPNAYLSTMVAWAATGLQPEALFVGYLVGILAGGITDRTVGWRLGGLTIGLFIPLVALPNWGIASVVAVMTTILSKKNGGILLTLVIAALSAASLLGSGQYVLMVMLAMGAMGRNVAANYVSGLGDDSQLQANNENERGRDREYGNYPAGFLAVLGSLSFVGLGAGYLAKQMKCNSNICTLCDAVVEGWNCKAVLLLGLFQPARTGLAEVALDLSYGWSGVERDPWVIVIMMVSIVIVTLAATYGIGMIGLAEEDQFKSAVTNSTMIIALAGFNPIVIVAVFGVALGLSLVDREGNFSFPVLSTGALM